MHTPKDSMWRGIWKILQNFPATKQGLEVTKPKPGLTLHCILNPHGAALQLCLQAAAGWVSRRCSARPCISSGRSKWSLYGGRRGYDPRRMWGWMWCCTGLLILPCSLLFWLDCALAVHLQNADSHNSPFLLLPLLCEGLPLEQWCWSTKICSSTMILEYLMCSAEPRSRGVFFFFRLA
jgi:hypothetical protein